MNHIVKFARRFNVEALNLKLFYYVEQVGVRSMCCSTTLFQFKSDFRKPDEVGNILL